MKPYSITSTLINGLTIPHSGGTIVPNMQEQPNLERKAEIYQQFDPSSILEHANENRNESQNEIAAETFSFFKDMLTTNGFTEYRSMNQAYNTLPGTEMIVRREDPRNVLQLFSEEEQYEVGFVGDDRYSNCVEWHPRRDGTRNISNAYLEGFTNLNSVVTVVGLERREDDDLVQLEDATQDFHGLDRRGVRSYKGPVTRERVKFINLRIPGHLLPESELTEDEIDRVDEYLDAREAGKPGQPVMVHRSYVFEEGGEQMKEAA